MLPMIGEGELWQAVSKVTADRVGMSAITLQRMEASLRSFSPFLCDTPLHPSPDPFQLDPVVNLFHSYICS